MSVLKHAFEALAAATVVAWAYWIYTQVTGVP